MRENIIPKSFTNEKALFHYTTKDTAIKFILHNKQLRFSQRGNSIDPLENQRPIFSLLGSNDTSTSNGVKYKAIDLYHEYNDKINSAKQICFCRNNPDKIESYTGRKPPEYYGFLKPRMWDQYGQKYQGVCFCFDETLAVSPNISLAGMINYMSYEKIHPASIIHINEVIPDEVAYQRQRKILDDVVEDYLLRKHEDYTGENEFRIISKAGASDEFLGIRESIKGMIVSTHGLVDFEKEQFIRYSRELKIDLLFIDWNYKSFNLETCDEHIRKLDIFKEMFPSKQ